MVGRSGGVDLDAPRGRSTGCARAPSRVAASCRRRTAPGSCSAPSTTWLLVTITPSDEITKPVPAAPPESGPPSSTIATTAGTSACRICGDVAGARRSGPTAARSPRRGRRRLDGGAVVVDRDEHARRDERADQRRRRARRRARCASPAGAAAPACVPRGRRRRRGAAARRRRLGRRRRSAACGGSGWRPAGRRRRPVDGAADPGPIRRGAGRLGRAVGLAGPPRTGRLVTGVIGHWHAPSRMFRAPDGTRRTISVRLREPDPGPDR